MEAIQIKANSIIDLVIQLNDITRKPQLIINEEVERKVKEIYGTPEYIEKRRKQKAELNSLINELIESL